MRISYWSLDVCSSDLLTLRRSRLPALGRTRDDADRARHFGLAVVRRRLFAASGGRRAAVGGRVSGRVDSALRHFAAPRTRWPVLAAGGADQPARRDGGGLLLAGNRSQRRLLPSQPAVESRRCGRRVPDARSVPVLLPVGNDAGADVLPDRAVGAQLPGRQGRSEEHTSEL